MNARMIIALVLGLSLTGAYANSFPTFEQLDVDGNGMLSESELEVIEQFKGEDSEFAEADGNDNGSLDSVEYKTWVELETGTASSDSNTSPKVSNN